MRTAAKIFKAFIWIFLVIYTIIQLGAITAIIMQNNEVVNNGENGTCYNVIPLVCVVSLMLVAVLLFMIFKKHRYIGLIVAVVAAVGMLVVALEMGRVFAPKSVSSDVGMTASRLFLNHIGIVIIPILMIPAWLCERKARKEEELAKEMMEKSTFHLDNEKIFYDEEDKSSNDILSSYEHPLKRSQKKRINK